MLDSLKKLLGNVARGGEQVINAPYNALAGLAKATSGAHPLPISQYVNPSTDPYYAATRPIQPITQYPQMIQQATYARNGQPGTLPLIPHQQPNLRLISGAYGALQPFGSVSENTTSPQQALQNTGYSNQTSLNGQLTQGPMSNFYHLMGK